MARSDFVLGSDVDRFETSFARFCGAQWAVGVANGTEAIHLALRALGVCHGDEVLVPANTFIATALGVTYTGARPVLVDCSEDNFLMDLQAAESKITDRTKVVLPVHLFGRMVDPEPILDLCARSGLTMVEDAAQAHGAETSGRRAGAAGTAGCFSFFPGKNLGAFGDAGAVVTSDASVRDRLRALRNYGSTEKYHHPEVGFNCRLDTIQAVVLNYKLERLPDASRARVRHAKGYQEPTEWGRGSHPSRHPGRRKPRVSSVRGPNSQTGRYAVVSSRARRHGGDSTIRRPSTCTAPFTIWMRKKGRSRSPRSWRGRSSPSRCTPSLRTSNLTASRRS